MHNVYNGIIVINKDAGMSSHDVVYRLRKITGQKKIGHMGTLDPQARGVLPVCLGSATRLSDLFLKADKQYRAVLRLGIRTDTQDMTGTVLAVEERIPDEEAVREAAGSFAGRISQIPPMYSAVKHQGKKLYELARKGVEIERKAREIMIREIRVEKVEHDRVTMLVTCSKGTYIRTLCADIGEKLGCGGCMEALTRTRSGPFRIEQAAALAELEPWPGKAVLLPVDSFFGMLPGWCTVPEDDYLLWNGNPLLIRDMKRIPEDREAVPGGGADAEAPEAVTLPEGLDPSAAIRLYDSTGSFWGVYQKANSRGLYRPWKMFPPG